MARSLELPISRSSRSLELGFRFFPYITKQIYFRSHELPIYLSNEALTLVFAQLYMYVTLFLKSTGLHLHLYYLAEVNISRQVQLTLFGGKLDKFLLKTRDF